MDKKLRKLNKDILRALRSKDIRCDLREIREVLIKEYGYEKEYKEEFGEEVDILRARIGNSLRALTDDNFLVRSQTGPGSSDHYSLTIKGHQEFDPWYKKLWRFFNDDFAKLLSVISVILSIVATIVSFSK